MGTKCRITPCRLDAKENAWLEQSQSTLSKAYSTGDFRNHRLMEESPKNRLEPDSHASLTAWTKAEHVLKVHGTGDFRNHSLIEKSSKESLKPNN